MFGDPNTISDEEDDFLDIPDGFTAANNQQQKFGWSLKRVVTINQRRQSSSLSEHQQTIRYPSWPTGFSDSWNNPHQLDPQLLTTVSTTHAILFLFDRTSTQHQVWRCSFSHDIYGQQFDEFVRQTIDFDLKNPGCYLNRAFWLHILASTSDAPALRKMFHQFHSSQATPSAGNASVKNHHWKSFYTECIKHFQQLQKKKLLDPNIKFQLLNTPTIITDEAGTSTVAINFSATASSQFQPVKRLAHFFSIAID